MKLPESGPTPPKIPFTCVRYHEEEMLSGSHTRRLAQKTHPEVLKIAIEKVHTLTLKAGVFELGQPIDPKTVDSTGKIIQQQTFLRTDRKVPLKLPEELKPDHAYYLIMHSDENLSLSIELVEKRVEELQNLFEKTLIEDKKLEIRRLQATLRGDVAETTRIINEEVKKLKPVKSLAEELESLGAQPQTPQSEEFQTLEKTSGDLLRQALAQLKV